ncbi:MAG: hypothetical protein N2C12_16115, partial [Planctomycetales bacterium]
MPDRLGFTVTLGRVWLWTLPIAAYSGLAAYVCLQVLPNHTGYVPNMSFGMEAAITFALGMMVAFRINRAYERWWEARTLWGTLVNISRNLAIKSQQLVVVPAADRKEIRRLIVGFCYALKD